ncbi:TrmH family RNA methyltransferase [Inhella sp.]|uniref:TrmH family RNA methyltransferase n=1 Tax=Inhella sp. TaxID=1921806 RepID=UPI0035B27E32
MSRPQVERITSPANTTLKALRKLAQSPDAYREQGRLWLEGDHLLQAALTRGRTLELAVIGESLFHERPDLQQLALRAPRVLVVADAVYGALTDLATPVPIAACVGWQAQVLQPGVASVVLDRLQDAGNVGSILRSAAALGVKQVLALKGTAALGSPKVLRAGMGAHFALHCVEGLRPEDLDALGLPLLATSSHGGQLLGQAPVPRPAAWVFGHEGKGVGDALMARCHSTWRIPQPGGEESLNVAAAAAICFYESGR